MATFSGGVAVLGWVDHELQWRGNLPEFERWRADLEALYVSAANRGRTAAMASTQRHEETRRRPG
jgi:uncharacterized membrane protein